MRNVILAAVSTAALLIGGAASAQAPKGGVNAGALNCTVAGGIGFVFGSTKDLSCTFSRPDGTAERYTGTVRKYGVDIGFTKEARIIWLVVAPGAVAPGALAGEYVGGTGSAAVGPGVGANVLIGGGSKQIALQPVSIEGIAGLNIAAGVVAIDLKKTP